VVDADLAGLLDVVEAAYHQHFGLTPARASVSFLGVQPITVLRFSEPEPQAGHAQSLTHYLSLGMCRYPMTDPSQLPVDDQAAPRAELLISAEGRPDELWRRLAVLAAAPAVEGVVYEPGGRLQLGEAIIAGSRCVGGVLVNGPLPPIACSGMADIQVMRVLPATSTELAWARVHGSAALIQRWTDHRTRLSDLLRDPVELSQEG
jgi:suppressor of fused protein SUFU